MPFIKRDETGQVIAVSELKTVDCDEVVDEGNSDLAFFLERMRDSKHQLKQSDFEVIRVIEDVVHLLIDKNIILFTELPIAAQEKLKSREVLRGQNNTQLNLLGDEDDKLY